MFLFDMHIFNNGKKAAVWNIDSWAMRMRMSEISSDPNFKTLSYLKIHCCRLLFIVVCWALAIKTIDGSLKLHTKRLKSIFRSTMKWCYAALLLLYYFAIYSFIQSILVNSLRSSTARGTWWLVSFHLIQFWWCKWIAKWFEILISTSNNNHNSKVKSK